VNRSDQFRTRRISFMCFTRIYYFHIRRLKFPVWWPGNKNSPNVTHACRKRRLKWVATLPLGDINTEAWSSGLGVGRGATTLPCKRENVEKPPIKSAGFCGGGQGLSWAVEPRKERQKEREIKKDRRRLKWTKNGPKYHQSDWDEWLLDVRVEGTNISRKHPENGGSIIDFWNVGIVL
jgi:hypothetical protein